jgi:hypothetical protein
MNIGLTYYFLIAMTFVFVCPYVTTEKSIMSILFNNVLVIIPSKHANDLNSNNGIKKKSKSINGINLLLNNYIEQHKRLQYHGQT